MQFVMENVVLICTLKNNQKYGTGVTIIYYLYKKQQGKQFVLHDTGD
jgi:hypothetical protein